MVLICLSGILCVVSFGEVWGEERALEPLTNMAMASALFLFGTESGELKVTPEWAYGEGKRQGQLTIH